MTPEGPNPTKGRTPRRRQAASVAHVRHELRLEQALTARAEGLSYRAIGARLRISGAQAHELVAEGLRRLTETSAEQADGMRRLELERLDIAGAKLLRIMCGHDSTALERVYAARTIVLVSESRRRLLGLDAPEKRAPVVVYSNPLQGLTQEQLEHIAATGELPEGVSLRGDEDGADDDRG